jgi:predicted nucleic-acid-binding protein
MPRLIIGSNKATIDLCWFCTESVSKLLTKEFVNSLIDTEINPEDLVVSGQDTHPSYSNKYLKYHCEICKCKLDQKDD